MNLETQDLILTVALSVLLIAVRWIGKRLELNDAKTEALEAIVIAVQAVKAEYVDDLKAASADGTLTDDEKAQARKKAAAKALAIAGPKAASLLVEWGSEKVNAYIEAAVAGKK